MITAKVIAAHLMPPGTFEKGDDQKQQADDRHDREAEHAVDRVAEVPLAVLVEDAAGLEVVDDHEPGQGDGGGAPTDFRRAPPKMVPSD
jgi:hypothetical protein